MNMHRNTVKLLVRNTTIFVAVLLTAFVLAGVLFVKYAPAQFSGFASLVPPFGGRSLAVEFCNSGAVITVGPPVGGRFYYQPGATRVFAHYQIVRPGVWLLGTRTNTPGVCFISLGKSLITLPYQGIINIVGTSLF
ncbi:MAG TPA: hypothetical protein VGA06_02870 [Candidatus Paceibacterota bacterium]|jgi:hypothetical protein